MGTRGRGGGHRYRFGIPWHLHEGGVLEEPELGGGDGAVLPDRHGRGGWWERSQGLVTWGGGGAPGARGWGGAASAGESPPHPELRGDRIPSPCPTPSKISWDGPVGVLHPCRMG